MTNVWIDSQPIDNGLMAVSVNIAEAPENLFGAAFHVVTSGAEWELSSYQMGTVFEGSEPFLLVTEKDDVLITGISLQRAQSAQIQDGELITFFVQPLEEGEISFDFDYPVLSTYQNGRKDVEGVEWVGVGVVEHVLEDSSQRERDETEDKMESTVIQGTEANVLKSYPALEMTFFNVYGLLFLFVIFMAIFSAYFWWTGRKPPL